MKSAHIDSPNGELVMQDYAMPKDTNPHGDMFGGWLVSQMDLAGCIEAGKYVEGRFVTVSIDRMSFISPVKVGHIVSCYTSHIKTGRTSIQIMVEVWSREKINTPHRKVTEGLFTFVAVDLNGKPRPIN